MYYIDVPLNVTVSSEYSLLLCITEDLSFEKRKSGRTLSQKIKHNNRHPQDDKNRAAHACLPHLLLGKWQIHSLFWIRILFDVRLTDTRTIGQDIILCGKTAACSNVAFDRPGTEQNHVVGFENRAMPIVEKLKEQMFVIE